MHGGDIYRNKVELDFSVNVNPFGVPDPVKEAVERSLCHMEQYPDPKCEELKGKISAHFNLDPRRIVCGNGASELITAICQWKRGKSAFVTGPGFLGYRKALASSGCEIYTYLLTEKNAFCPDEEFIREIGDAKPDLLFLANPSNPTGVLLTRSYMEQLLETCRKQGVTVVVDECFMELTGKAGEYSLAFPEYLKRFDNLLILRAFTKSFAIPGLRLGYLLCGTYKAAEAIAEKLAEWNVSIPAQAAGCAAFECGDYLKESTAYIAAERKRISKCLEETGVVVFPGSANFILFRWKEKELYRLLLDRGILIRDCSDYEGLGKGFYRIAVKRKEENNRLMRTLKELSAE